jgi:hypothetical protein
VRLNIGTRVEAESFSIARAIRPSGEGTDDRGPPCIPVFTCWWEVS